MHRRTRTLVGAVACGALCSCSGEPGVFEEGGASEHPLAYGGISVSIPGRVEAERFDQGGPNIGYFDTTTGNSGGQFRTNESVDIEVSAQGGFNVGWLAQGEWLAYGVNVATAGKYDLNASVAALANGGAFHLEVGGVNVSGPITVPATGGYQTWTQVKVANVTLAAGAQVIRLVADAANFNVDWFELTRAVGSDPTCATGVPNVERTVCCAASCGACGGTGCDTRPGGAAACCASGVTAAGASCSGSLPPCVLTPVAPPSGAITAKTAAAGMANGFNVGNTFETNQHPRTTASVSAMIDAYYAEGFRTVRIPIRWIGTGFADGDLASASGVVNKAHARLGVIQAVVDYAIAKGMYVIINTHHDNWLFDSAWSTSKYAVHRNLWAGICDVFKSRSARLIFEVINEPHGSIRFDAPVVRTINQNAYEVIRACGGNNATRNIIIDGLDWGGPTSLQNTWPQVTQIPGGGNDPYVMGSIHFYDPLDLTHAGSAAGINTAWSAGDIRNKLNAVSTWAAGKLPIFVGEFGVNWDQHAHTINANTYNWYKAVADQTRARGWAFTVWDDGGWFRVMDRSTRAFNSLQNACVP